MREEESLHEVKKGVFVTLEVNFGPGVQAGRPVSAGCVFDDRNRDKTLQRRPKSLHINSPNRTRTLEAKAAFVSILQQIFNPQSFGLLNESALDSE